MALPEQPGPPGTSRRWPSADHPGLIGLVMVIGVGLRCWPWLGQRSLWIDEATVATGLLWRPWSAIWGGHPFGQMSPPAWLALVRGSAELFGVNELALRAPTLLLAIGYLPVIWLLVRRIAGAEVALLALVISAVSPGLVNYAVEVKPYGSDPLFAAAALAVAIPLGNGPLGWRRGLAWGCLLGIICLWSNPASIVVVSVIAAGLAAGWLARASGSSDLGSRLLVGLVGLGIFAVVYRGHFRLEPWLVSYLDSFFHDRFLDPGWDLPQRIWRSLVQLVSRLYYGGGGDLIPALVWLPIGFGIQTSKRALPRPLLVALLGPLGLIAVLAVARRYPIVARLDLFTAPITTLFLATGLVTWYRRTRRPWLAGGAMALTVVLMARTTIGFGLDPIQDRGHARPLIAELARLRRPDEVTYVFARAAPEWFFYSTDWARPDTNRIARVEAEYRFPRGRTFAGGLPRGAPVAPIGDDLRYHYRGASEVYGIYSGFLWRTSGFSRAVLDPGWLEVERDRILRDQPACVWLVALFGARLEKTALKAAIEASGYPTWREWESGGSILYRGCRTLPGPPSGAAR